MDGFPKGTIGQGCGLGKHGHSGKIFLFWLYGKLREKEKK